MLQLVPILRENMPPVCLPGWLKRKNRHDAQTALLQAEKEGLVDLHVLNNFLEMEATMGSIDRVLEFHDKEFKRHRIAPNPFSDRLVLQMLVKQNRYSRALKFKEEVESQGRTLDLLSYATLIEHCGNHSHLGSALMMLRECISVHGSPPGERQVQQIRRICRREGLEKEVGLRELIGEDPLEWLKEGQAKRKREKSKKGNRLVRLPRDIALQI